MKSIVLYYSYNGHTKKVAEKLAGKHGAALAEIQTEKRRGKLLTFLVDCPLAMMRKPAKIKPITADLAAFDMITIAAPVWAGKPAPAFNAAVKLLPKGKNVQLILVSAGGPGATKRSEDGTRMLVKHQGCTVVDYKDVKQP